MTGLPCLKCGGIKMDGTDLLLMVEVSSMSQSPSMQRSSGGVCSLLPLTTLCTTSTSVMVLGAHLYVSADVSSVHPPFALVEPIPSTPSISAQTMPYIINPGPMKDGHLPKVSTN